MYIKFKNNVIGEIREERLKDARDVSEILSLTSKTLALTQISESAHRDWYLQKRKKKAILLVCEIGKKVVGFICIEPELGKLSHVANIGIAVHPEYQGIGIGKALMIVGMREAKKRGIKKFCLQVLATNERAIRLYKSLGFIEEGRLRKQFRKENGEYEDMIIMGKFVE